MDLVERALATLDADTRRCAEAAVDRLLGPVDNRLPLELLTRLELQDFLWVKLPTKVRSDAHDHHEVAWALGDLLEKLGQTRYAALCRDRRTHEILATWHRDEDAGVRAATEAIEASGLAPPDTAAVVFGEVMGGAELRAYLELAGVIEHAVDQGDLLPGSATFEADRVALAERFWRGGTALSGVRRSRAEAWAMGFRADPDWLQPALPLLEQAWSTPENVELSLLPARALLEKVGHGLVLTAAGQVPASAAVELNDRFRWSDRVGHPAGGEADLPQLTVLREHLTLQGLLHVSHGNLSVTEVGTSCLVDGEQFWGRLTDLHPRWDAFSSEVVAVSAALLLMAPDVEREDLAAEVSRMIGHRWTGAGDFDRDVHWAYIDWYRVGQALGWWEARRGRWLDRLSPRGVGAAARAFWSVAGAPQAFEA